MNELNTKADWRKVMNKDKTFKDNIIITITGKQLNELILQARSL